MSATYSSFYQYKVELTATSLKGREFTSVSDKALVFKGQSSGFTILRRHYGAKWNKNIFRFNIDGALLERVKGSEDRFYLLTKYLRDNLISKLSEQITLQSISTDTLYFTFRRTAYKRVKVAVNGRFSYKEQYMPFEAIKTEPDSIEIHGPADILEGIDSVETLFVGKKNIHQTFQGSALLKQIPEVTYSDNEIYYSRKVGRFFENSFTVPLSIINAPEDDFVLLTPNEVTISYREDYDFRKEYKPTDFHPFVDYNKAESSLYGKAWVQLRQTPQGVYNITLTPDRVEVVIIRK